MLSFDFSGQTALVTGAASGIGKATATLFAQSGANVVIADINAENGKAVAQALSKDGANALFASVDVSKPDQIKEMVAMAEEKFGHVDILCNNAADLSLLARDDHLLNSEADIWEETFRADAISVAVASKHVLPGMLRHGRGAIINISSVDGLLGDDTRFGYAMAKAAVDQLTRMIATRYGKQGILCNSIAPGLVITPAAKLGLTPEVIEVFDENTLVPGHGAAPEDVAKTVAFLASDGARYINGEAIRVDGGLLSHVQHFAGMRSVYGIPDA